MFVFCDTHFRQQVEIHYYLAAKKFFVFFLPSVVKSEPHRET